MSLLVQSDLKKHGLARYHYNHEGCFSYFMDSYRYWSYGLALESTDDFNACKALSKYYTHKSIAFVLSKTWASVTIDLAQSSGAHSFLCFALLRQLVEYRLSKPFCVGLNKRIPLYYLAYVLSMYASGGLSGRYYFDGPYVGDENLFCNPEYDQLDVHAMRWVLRNIRTPSQQVLNIARIDVGTTMSQRFYTNRGLQSHIKVCEEGYSADELTKIIKSLYTKRYLL